MAGRTTKFQTHHGVFLFQFIIPEAETSLSSDGGWGAAQVNPAGGWTESWEALWAQNPVCRDLKQICLSAHLFIHSLWAEQLRDIIKKGFECWGQELCFPHLGLLDRLWEQSPGLTTAGLKKCPWVQDKGKDDPHSGVYWRKMTCACRSWHYRERQMIRN